MSKKGCKRALGDADIRRAAFWRSPGLTESEKDLAARVAASLGVSVGVVIRRAVLDCIGGDDGR